MHAFDRRTDGRTDGQTDGQTDRRTDRNLIIKTALHSMQRGKKGSSYHAIYSVRRVVDYYVNGVSTVNVCLLDLSKALDKMNYLALFTRNSPGDEIANVNFLYDDIVHALQNTIDSCINSPQIGAVMCWNACLPNSVK